MNTEQVQYIHRLTHIPSSSIAAVVHLIEGGNTVPFIARYRKEAHGNLDVEHILNIKDYQQQYDKISHRQQFIIDTIKNEGKLTQKLKHEILQCFDSQTLEDYYLPFKKKRKTKADKAISLGLEKLMQTLEEPGNDFNFKDIKEYLRINRIKINADKALELCIALYASRVNEQTDIRRWVRNIFDKHGQFSAKVKKGKEKEGELYKSYFKYVQSWSSLPSYRVLAMLRAENKGILRINLRPERQKTITELIFFISKDKTLNKFSKKAITYAYKNHLEPSIEKEFISEIRGKAQLESAETFAQNLKTLLLSPPIRNKPLIAIDPGIRTGHKIVVLSSTGDLIAHSNQNFRDTPSSELMKKFIESQAQKHDISSIAIGNGTGGREAYNWLNEHFDFDLFLVDESGASVYSASEEARKEFPALDITFRGAISIGRRLQNPLAELIKIDPKSLGIGQYHHDIPIKILKEKVDTVTELCVNKVGVDLNTASQILLSYVSGIGSSLAESIVEYRNQHGNFNSLEDILNIHGVGPKSYEQAAGFLRILDATNYLERTNIHPEQYSKVKEIASVNGVTVEELFLNNSLITLEKILEMEDEKTGKETLTDIYHEIKTPGRDFRNTATPIQFSENIHTIKDLKLGLKLKGVVTNITDFGAFIDVGIKENGLVHKSEISDDFIESPFDKLDLMQQVEVKVLEVDIEAKRIKLSMKK